MDNVDETIKAAKLWLQQNRPAVEPKKNGSDENGIPFITPEGVMLPIPPGYYWNDTAGKFFPKKK
jgi:hypothetical protein